MGKINRNLDNKNFTILGNEFLQDKFISLKTKGLIALILSLPADWNLTMSGLEKIVTDGQSSVNSAFKEGIKAGYIKMVKTNKGKFEVDYFVSHKKEFKAVKEEFKIDNAADALHIVDYYLKRFNKGNKQKALEVLKGAFGNKGVIFGNKEKIIQQMDLYFDLKIDFKYRKNIETFLSDGYWEQDFEKKEEQKEDKKTFKTTNDNSDYDNFYKRYLMYFRKEIPMRGGIFDFIIDNVEATRELTYDEFLSVWKYKKQGYWTQQANDLLNLGEV